MNIKLNNNSYPIPDSALAGPTADFVTHLGTIAGSGLKVVVGGVEYSVDATKVAGAVSEIEGVLAGLDNSTPQLNEYGFYYDLPYSGYIAYFDTTAYLFVHENGTSTVYLADTIERGDHTIDGNTLTYASPSMGELHFVFSEDGTSAQLMELGATIALGDNSVMIDADYVYTYNEELGGYEVANVVDNTKSSYGTIKSSLNGNDTVKIGRAFCNCESVSHIGYDGTIKQWNSLDKSLHSASITVACSDGNVQFGGYAEIEDSWEEIIASVNDGTYATKYKVGQYKPLDLGAEGAINMQIAALDADALSDGTGNAHITWIAQNLLATTHVMNSTNTNANGWEASEMRTYLSEDVWALIPATVQNSIVAVDKPYYDYTTRSTLTCSDKLWIPSAREVNFPASYYAYSLENSGVVYSELFHCDDSRIKERNGSACWWWLRSANPYISNYFCLVDSDYNHDANDYAGVALSFCM